MKEIGLAMHAAALSQKNPLPLDFFAAGTASGAGPEGPMAPPPLCLDGFTQTPALALQRLALVHTAAA